MTHDHTRGDLALLAAGHETGWYDEHGTPAPFPADFWQPDGTINPNWRESTTHEVHDDLDF